jgi:hypothetical protein
MKRIFMVGCPRSGTTLIQQFFVENYYIYSIPETHYYSLLNPSSRLGRILQPRFYLKFKAQFKLSKILGFNVWKSFSFDERFLLKTIDSYASKNGYGSWLEKTPRHLHFVKDISLNEEVVFVHVVRNGLDTSRSLLKAYTENKKHWKPFFGRSMSESDAINRWNSDIKESAKYIGRVNHYFVVYEDYLSGDHCLHKLAQNIGLKRRSVKASSSDVIQEHEVWKKNNFKNKIVGKENIKAEFYDSGDYLYDEFEEIRRYANSAIKK